MTSADLWSALEASWPPAKKEQLGPFVWRDGAGGGSRVSAATCNGAVDATALDKIEDRFASEGRDALFQLRQDDDAFDALLEKRGYKIADATVCLAAPATAFQTPQPDTAYASWPPIAAQRNIWLAGGIDPSRLQVMKRAQIAKTTFLARLGETPAGTAFVAALGSIAVLHALEVSPECRRKGVAHSLMSHAALWAKTNGASTLAVLVTRANTSALALYSSLGMYEVDHYHYRRKGPL